MNLKVLLVLLVALWHLAPDALSTLAQTAPAPPRLMYLTFVVGEFQKPDPVPGASVVIRSDSSGSMEAQTDGAGIARFQFQVANLTAFPLFYTVSYQGFKPEEGSWTLSPAVDDSPIIYVNLRQAGAPDWVFWLVVLGPLIVFLGMFALVKLSRRREGRRRPKHERV